MKDEFPIISTKLTPPIVKKNFLQRPNLMRRLNRIKDFPVTIIHSGPGYGKSSALSALAKAGPLPITWYTVTKQDDDLAAFLHYIICGIRRHNPTFGKDILDRIKNDKMSGEDARLLCILFVNQLENMLEERIIVIDDFHLIQNNESITEWIKTFIEYLPNHIHLVLSTRVRPDWPMLAAYRARNLLLEITKENFKFTAEETEILFSDLFGIEIGEENADLICRKTEGWVMAIQMIGQQVIEKEDLVKIIENETETLLDLFDFLAFEVLSKQPDDLQDFLLQSSVFEEMNAELLGSILCVENPRNALNELNRQNMFLSTAGAGQFRYHSLFREFLVMELKKRDMGLFESVNCLAGAYFKEREMWEEALHHYMQIEDTEATAAILSFYGSRMLEMGRLDSLQELLGNIPVHIKNAYPLLLINEGDIRRYRCEYEEAVSLYEKALTVEGRNGSNLHTRAALVGLARVYLDTIQPAKAKIYLDRAIAGMTDLKQSGKEETDTGLYRLMAENLINLGRAREAERWAMSSHAWSDNQIDKENIQARLYLRTGRLKHARAILEKQRERDGANISHLQLSHRETELLLSLINSFQGEADAAKKTAQAGMRQGIEYRAPFVEACGWIRTGHAVLLTDGDNTDYALTCYQTSLEMMDRINVSRGKAEPFMGLAILYAKKGDFTEAKIYADKALKETEVVQDKWLSALIRVCHAIIFYYQKRMDQAAEMLDISERAFAICGDEYGLAVVSLWKALISFEQKDWDAFDIQMTKLFKQVREHDYVFLFELPTLFGPFDLQNIPPLLLAAEDRNVGKAYADFLLSKLGIVKNLIHPGFTLKITMLGNFAVKPGNRELKADDWRRDKAKELFQYLLTHRHGWTEKQEILGALWGGQDELAAASGLKVALTTLNKVLEPDRKARQKPFYIERDGTAYRINMAAGIELDIDLFENLLEKGLREQERFQAAHWLEKGLKYYQGDFLQERRYEDWCLEERERLSVLYLRGAEKLAQLQVSFKEYDKAIWQCGEILKKDHCWEEAYRLLIFCYYQKNNRPQAIKLYEKCRTVLSEELGVEPMPATEQMYRMVMEKNPAIH